MAGGKDWVIVTPGVVFALAAAVRAYTKEGDSVMIQRPVYHPFTNVVKENGRKLVNNPLVMENGKYHMDYEDMERKITEEQVKLFCFAARTTRCPVSGQKKNCVRLPKSVKSMVSS